MEVERHAAETHAIYYINITQSVTLTYNSHYLTEINASVLKIHSESSRGHLLGYHVTKHTLPYVKPLLSHSCQGALVDRRVCSADQSARRSHPRLTELLDRKSNLMGYHATRHTLPSLKPLLSHSYQGALVDRGVCSANRSGHQSHPRLTEAPQSQIQ